ncbi:hypothetical protein [Sphingomonas aerophila]|jgi:hypothetical protein|uniref:Uncharacterized protein n=1 Tax=Sphingomonas aerophila TaxID=1344948 RepID=A0A7W9BGY2_9SPHN|nr:hypothetical protein [Sphingomonas aerophila]MBB5717054.1 hypothetical protein [Sphingomonas aerophila]
MNEFWKKPAILWCRRDGQGAPSEEQAVSHLNSGSLEAMVRAAIEAEAVHSAREAILFIDVDAKRMLSFAEIRRLRGAPDFPVEI